MRFLGCLLVLLLFAPLVAAQQSAWLTDAERARFEELRRSGLDALYNIDYDKAQREFKEIVKLYPNHPGGYQLLAARVWIKTLYESRRLQASLYSSDSFYSNGDDKVDPKIVSEFRGYTREAKRLAEAKLKQEPKNIEALDFLANTEGLMAAFEEAVERRHFAALRDGNDAVNRHREVLKLDPEYIDAQITIGLYEYVVGSLPLPVKILAGATGFRGSKKRGLRMLEQVAQGGTWARDDAKSVLIVLYTREKRFADKVKLARELSEKYPRNYLLRLETADGLVSLAAQKRKENDVAGAAQAEKEAFATFDDILRDRNVREAAGRALDLIHFKYGEALLTAGNHERAAKEFLATTRVDRAEAGLVTMAHLYAARAYDAAGKRDEALAQYKEVLSRPNVYDAHEEAKRGMKQAYKGNLTI
ncbi:MAG TPA: tetratricopeptide repeat protein [Pyrinomonadaceae bacterium]|nr:tetratricopeptide repeat protein [Pyrinomonadaceae bacterium]